MPQQLTQKPQAFSVHDRAAGLSLNPNQNPGIAVAYKIPAATSPNAAACCRGPGEEGGGGGALQDSSLSSQGTPHTLNIGLLPFV